MPGTSGMARNPRAAEVSMNDGFTFRTHQLGRARRCKRDFGKIARPLLSRRRRQVVWATLLWLSLCLVAAGSCGAGGNPWQTFPEPTTKAWMAQAKSRGCASIRDIEMYYAVFGE